MNIIFIIVYIIMNFLSLKYQLHIFQLNYYMPDTQMKWVLKNWKKFLIISIINIIGIIMMFINQTFAIILINILLIINIILVIEKNVKKKIVYTNRVKRLFITNYLALLILGIALFYKFNILVIVLLGINIVFPIYTIILNYINIPINNIINKYYISDAKKILNNMPNLKIIAVTGSYGKTSTKNYLTKILSSKYNVLCTAGNFIQTTPLGVWDKSGISQYKRTSSYG